MSEERWPYPSDWLDEHIDSLHLEDVRNFAHLLARTLTEDDIQDLFQPEMIEDGFFGEEDEEEAE